MLILESLSLVVAIGAGILVFALPLAIFYTMHKLKLQSDLVIPLAIFMLVMPIVVGYYIHNGGKKVQIIENIDGMTRTDGLAYGNPVYRFKDGSERSVGGPPFFYDGTTVVNDTERSLILVAMTYSPKGTAATPGQDKIRETLPPTSVTSLDQYIRFFGWGPDGPGKSVWISGQARRVLVYWLTWPQDKKNS